MKVKIVQSDKELKDTFDIRKKVFVDEQGVSIEEELDQYEREAIHFIGYDNHNPIAAARLRFVDKYGKLERLCILKNYRGRSYGSLMIKEMEFEIRKHNYSWAKLNAQTRATGFYERLGYEVVSDEFMDARIPHVTMIKQLF